MNTPIYPVPPPLRYILAILLGFLLLNITNAWSAGLTVSTTNTAYRLGPGSYAIVAYTLTNNTGASINPSKLNYVPPANYPSNIESYSQCYQLNTLASAGTCTFEILFKVSSTLPNSAFNLDPPVVCITSSQCYAGNSITITPAPFIAAYVLNNAAATTSVNEINATTDQWAATVTGLPSFTPNFIRANHNGRKVYVSDGGTHVYRIDVATNAYDGMTYTLSGCSNTNAVDLSPDDTILWVGCTTSDGSGILQRVPESTGSPITASGSCASCRFGSDIEVSPDGLSVFGSDQGNNNGIRVFDTTSSVTQLYVTGGFTNPNQGIAINRATAMAWVADNGGTTSSSGGQLVGLNTVQPASTNIGSTTTALALYPIGNPNFLGTSPDGTYMIVATTLSYVQIYNGLTMGFLSIVKVTNSTDAKVSPDNTKAYVTTNTTNSIVVLGTTFPGMLLPTSPITNGAIASVVHLTFVPWIP